MADEDGASTSGCPVEVLDAVREVVAGALSEPLESVGVDSAVRLSGGASRLTWEVTTTSGPPVIVQQERPGSAGANLAMSTQSELLRCAAANGVPVPAVLGEGGETGSEFVVLAKVAGESLPRRIQGSDRLASARSGLARQAGQACARIHSIQAADTLTAELPRADPLRSMRSLLDALGEPHPAFELGLAQLGRTRPEGAAESVVHGDFRMGNLLVGEGGLTAVLDWELAHIGDPAEDLGWFCARAWRFGSPLRAGGVGSVEDLLAGYANGGGVPPTRGTLDWWEAYACLRWGLICVLQASVHLRGLHRSVELAAIGRRAGECEEDLLELVIGPSDVEPPTQPSPVRHGPHDAPGAGELAEAVAEALDRQVARSSGADRFELRVAANAVGIIGRELAYGDLLAQRHRQRLDGLGVIDDAALSASIRDGSMDRRWDEVATAVRGAVRDKLAVSNPGYWTGDNDPARS